MPPESQQQKTVVAMVTIGMPVYNCAGTLSQTIRSLELQTFRDWKLIMIDDGSNDRTSEVARQFQDERIVFLCDGKHRGLPARLNEILQLVQTRYFARMDADDIAYPTRLERQLNYLETHPEIDLVGTGIAVFGRDGTLLGKRTVPEHHASICESPHRGFFLAHPTFLGKVGWFRQYGYRENAIRCEDQDLLLRSYQSSRFGNVPDILLGYREERLLARKILTARWHFGLAVAREFSRRRKFGTVFLALGTQCLKSVIDWIAMSTGIGHKLLRHRACRTTHAERLEWQIVWERVSRGSS